MGLLLNTRTLLSLFALVLFLSSCQPDVNLQSADPLDIELEEAIAQALGENGKTSLTMPKGILLSEIPQDPRNPLTQGEDCFGARAVS
jgi:hypothetical protein